MHFLLLISFTIYYKETQSLLKNFNLSQVQCLANFTSLVISILYHLHCQLLVIIFIIKMYDRNNIFLKSTNLSIFVKCILTSYYTPAVTKYSFMWNNSRKVTKVSRGWCEKKKKVGFDKSFQGRNKSFDKKIH